MELLNNLAQGFGYIFGFKELLIIIVGVVLGILGGAMPGLSPSMAVALLVPFTYKMSPMLAIILLVAIYQAANYGGSITAVTINTPGTPAAAVTAIDGYQLTRMGKPGKGLGTSLVASTIGGMIGVIVLIFFSVPLAKVAVRIHPADYFALAMFGLTTVASLGGANWAKAFAAAVFGLLLNTIGIDPISGVNRFTFGILHLYDGFALIPALIGLFALSEVFMGLEEYRLKNKVIDRAIKDKPTLKEYWQLKFTILRSSIIGTLIGIFPGAGATIASFISYDIGKRTSKHPELFGKGSLEGVASSEAANSSSVGGALIPLLTLGIPGSATDAVLIGALMMHNLNPGPQLFIDRPDIVYGLFASLILANFVMLILGSYGIRIWGKVTLIPKSILYPMIIVVSVIGSFAVKYSFFDVASCIGFGIFGWILRRYKYPVAPVVLGMVLGKLAEENFRRAVMMGGYTIFFQRPASLIIILIALFSFAFPFYQNLKKKKAQQ